MFTILTCLGEYFLDSKITELRNDCSENSFKCRVHLELGHKTFFVQDKIWNNLQIIFSSSVNWFLNVKINSGRGLQEGELDIKDDLLGSTRGHHIL